MLKSESIGSCVECNSFLSELGGGSALFEPPRNYENNHGFATQLWIIYLLSTDARRADRGSYSTYV